MPVPAPHNPETVAALTEPTPGFSSDYLYAAAAALAALPELTRLLEATDPADVAAAVAGVLAADLAGPALMYLALLAGGLADHLAVATEADPGAVRAAAVSALGRATARQARARH